MPTMRSTESIFLRLERPGYPMDVAAVYVLGSAPEDSLRFDEVRDLFAQRLGDSPIATRVIAHAPLRIGEDRWAQLDAVDIESHVHHRVVDPPGDWAALLETVLEVSSQPLDREKPLWEAWYLTGMDDGRAALVLRLHHAVADGMGMIALQQRLFDEAPTPPPEHDHRPTSRIAAAHPSLARRVLLEVPTRLVANTVATTRLLGRIAQATVSGSTSRQGPHASHPGYVPSLSDPPPVTLFNQYVSNPSKSMAFVQLPFEKVQAARGVVPGATVNDVLLALVTGAMRTYLDAHGGLPDKAIRTTCPVNVRAADEGGLPGNHITTMWIDLPVHLGDPVQRLAAVHASSAAAKEALPQTQADWDSLADVGDLLLPGIVQAAMAFAGSRAFGLFPPTQNLTVSTLAGSREPLYLATRRIDNVFLRGIICPPVHLFFAAITYNQHVDVSVTTVHQLCPDPQVIADAMAVELDLL